MNRKQQLRNNFRNIYWVQALTSIRLFAMVSSLFYVSRGLDISQIFYLGIIWSAANVLSEVPSSYMADRWGRKPTIVVGILLALACWCIYLVGSTFLHFALAIAAFGMSYAMFSGTDEALLYDSAKELGEEKSHGLKRLATYHSAKRVLKIASPIIAVLIARDLSPWQFQMIIILDLLTVLIALFFGLRLVEADHKMNVRDVESSILHDAVTLLKSEKELLRTILNRLLPFIGSLMIWMYMQVFFTDLGVSLLAIGIGWSLMQLGSYLLMTRVIPKYKGEETLAINFMTNITVVLTAAFLFAFFLLDSPLLLFALFALYAMFEVSRNPLYSSYFNKHIRSFNRATTLSLTNLLKALIDIPLLLLMAYLVQFGLIVPYIIAFWMCGAAAIFFRVKEPHTTNTDKTAPQY